MQSDTEIRNSLKSLKFRNRKVVLSFLRNSGSVSVNDIARATGLSKMTIHKIIDHYIDNGMVSLVGKGFSTDEGGKKPNLFAFNPNCRFMFAIRLGDGYINTSIINLKGEILICKNNIPVAGLPFNEIAKMARRDFDEYTGALNLEHENCLTVVVGSNGVIDADKGVCVTSYHYPEWGTNFPIQEWLKEYMPPNISVRVNSWWRHMAKGEIYLSDPDNKKRFYVIGNTGDHISGCLVVDGQVFQGNSGFAGEIGHIVVEPSSSERCVCGGYGCLESLVAPSRMMAAAHAKRDAFPNSAIFAGDDGKGLDFCDLLKAAERGDPLAADLLDKAIGHFAVAVSNVIHTCDPGILVFFGDYGCISEFFLKRLRERVESMSFVGIDKNTEFQWFSIHDNSGVMGAANYVADRLFSGVI